MSAKKPVTECHRAVASKLKGTKLDSEYGYWAYWCGAKRDGWRAKPCEHARGTKHERDQ